MRKSSLVFLVRHKHFVVVIALLVLAVTGVIGKLVDIAARPISRHNEQYLNKSIESTVHLMVPIGL